VTLPPGMKPLTMKKPAPAKPAAKSN
jgi:hypothetical protein